MGLRKGLVTLFVLCFVVGLNLANNNFTFRHLTLEDGLSNSFVNCIVQDSNGFIWMGTENGLNKYDGYSFKHYYSDVNSKNSLFSNEILSMLVDSSGVIWIGTFQGLFRYNEVEDNFDNIRIDEVDQLNANIPVYAILEDANDILWIGTSGNGLIKYNEKTGNKEFYYHNDTKKNTISSNYIFTLYKNQPDILWIGTTDNGLDKLNTKTGQFFNYKPIKTIKSQQNVNAIIEIFEYKKNTFLLGTRGDGLFTFNTQNKQFEPFVIETHSGEKLNPIETYSIYRDSKNRLWISSHGKGLFCYDNSKRAERLEHSDELQHSLINNNARTIFEDRQGNLWVVSYQGGVNILPNVHKKFDTYNLADDSEYASKIVTSISTDKNSNLWVGTDGGGLKYYNRKTDEVKHYYPGPNRSLSIPDKVVMNLFLEENKKLWIGSYLGGLSILDLQTGKFKNYVTSEEPSSISCNFVSSILKSTKGEYWIGTNGGGLNRFNVENETFYKVGENHPDFSSNPINNYVNCIAEDNNGRLWIGTFWGLTIYDPLNGMFINYKSNKNKPGSLSNNTVYCIKITSRNQIWLGTRNGLNTFEPARNTFKSFNLADGLPGNVIYSIEEDEDGDLWLSTNNGLCNFNPITYETHNYYESDGLVGQEFFRQASHKASNGELFFGSLNGLISFHPDSIIENSHVPKAKITQFRVFNQEVKPGKSYQNQVLLKKPVYLTDTITLKHRFNNFAFEFAALDYTLPEKTNYKCKMVGFDNDWRLLASDHRYVSYTNLDPGEYVFKLKASSIDNEWDNKVTKMVVIIKPPIYRTWWAFLFYYMLLAGIILFFWIMSIRRVKLINQVSLAQVERAKAEEVNQAKLRFFTNISHEFRTPITLILGPLEKMLNDKQIVKKYKGSLDLMHKNANRLLRLVNQIMDLRKIESGKMRLKTEKADIIVFLKDIYKTFEEYAGQKRIEFRFLSEVEELVCWFDPDKLDKIVFNLLSNAFKFTRESGEIELFIEKTKLDNNTDGLKISVTDTGVGIAEEDQEKIFERFYQNQNPAQNYSKGSGLGLSLTHSLVQQHHGQINFNSVEGKGTTFNVVIPLSEAAYSDEEKFAPEVPGVNKYLHVAPEEIVEEDFKFELSSDKNAVLIVEDNYDLRKYLVKELGSYFNTYEASNGAEGLKIALDKLPELIISDVVMPEMDGLELCRRIKENFITNHIPVILLTARASIEHRIKGIEYGADSYIPKPFNPAHLKMRIKKLLELRMVLKEKYARELESPDQPIDVEEDFYLKKLKQIINKNLDDPNLSIDKICKEIGVSRAHFYRKIKLLTSKSPTEYIRILRLNEAAKLLAGKKYSISEVCYMVGFNSPSYFSICFKELFNVLPNEYIKKEKDK